MNPITDDADTPSRRERPETPASPVSRRPRAKKTTARRGRPRKPRKLPPQAPHAEWAGKFATVRAVTGLSQEQAAKMLEVHIRTISRWERGLAAPLPAARAGILAALRHTRMAPTKARREQLERSHHLFYDPLKGWTFRCTIDLGPKRVGKRVKTVLRTRDLETAILKRETILDAYRTLGLKVSLRVQKPLKKNEEAVSGEEEEVG